jgi:aminoglycoside 3-N-acetyltransferase
MADDLLRRPPITRTQLIEQIEILGLQPGSVVMVHCSLSSLGYVVGGADTVVTAIFDLLGPAGTLVAMTGWEHDASGFDELPTALQDAYRRDPPAFDPEVSEAAREYGRLPERIRTWPGARHSFHPECRFSAIGAQAEWITKDQPWDHPYGPKSPLAKLVEADGYSLLLGAPLETLTVLHLAEELASVLDKKTVRYKAPIKTASGIEWREVEDIDTTHGAFPYERVVGDRDSFEVMAEEALAAGIGTRGRVGESQSHLFPAADLVRFGIAWIEKRFA